MKWTTPNRFWSNGHDSSIPDMREARLIKDANAVYEGVEFSIAQFMTLSRA